MDSWATWIWGVCEPIAKRVAVALGFGYLSFEGASTALESAFGSIQASFGGLLAEVAALLAMSGFFDAMAIMSGGILSGLAWMAMKRWAVVGAGTPA
jgi:hypothetical protein